MVETNAILIRLAYPRAGSRRQERGTTSLPSLVPPANQGSGAITVFSGLALSQAAHQAKVLLEIMAWLQALMSRILS
jgi:hypothetical protein